MEKSSLTVDEINAELARLFESDVKEFSENGAKAFGHILAKRGIENPQKWLEEKMRETKDPSKPPYSLSPNFGNILILAQCREKDKIEFRSMDIANQKFTRAHEMVHKISIGLYDDESFEGMGLNEGVTNLIASRLCGIAYRKGQRTYVFSTFSAWILTKLFGKDSIFEANLFEPKIMENKFGSKKTYSYILHMIDKIQYPTHAQVVKKIKLATRRSIRLKAKERLKNDKLGRKQAKIERKLERLEPPKGHF